MLQLNGPARISSFCAADKPQCVKVGFVREARTNMLAQLLLGPRTVVKMTDTKLGEESPVVTFHEKSWKRFCDNVDDWRPASDGQYRFVDLAFDPEEYEAFRKGVKNGEFEIVYEPDSVYA